MDYPQLFAWPRAEKLKAATYGVSGMEETQNDLAF